MLRRRVVGQVVARGGGGPRAPPLLGVKHAWGAEASLVYTNWRLRPWIIRYISHRRQRPDSPRAGAAMLQSGLKKKVSPSPGPGT
eukprot:scaffold11918_cov174-Isochrysis_galbana.AAC.1